MTSTTLKPSSETTAVAGTGTGTAAEPPRRRGMSAPLRTVLALPAFALAGYLAWLAFTNIAYPLRSALGLPGYTRDSWGGPTYAGVWAVHGAGGLAMLAAASFIVRPIVRPIVRRRTR